MERLKESDKALKLKIRHLKLLKLESNYLAHFELSDYTQYVSPQDYHSFESITYNDMLNKLDENGKFTRQTAIVV